MREPEARDDGGSNDVRKARFHLPPYDFAAALEISEHLGLKLPIAASLVRRGLSTSDEVEELIAGVPEHDPFLFDGMERAVESIIGVARSGGLITVHGDYDADGVCATSVLVECLREIGAEVDWYLPDRQGGGYGVSRESIDALTGRETALMITVDCGIGSGDEVAELQERGIRCVVTDHHQAPEQLPDCPVIHPALGGYPFPGLCGAGVAYKLASALRREAGAEGDSGVDLVALATVADLVPLTDENRTLVRRGLNSMRTSPRIGMRALMDAARVSPGEVDSGALGFRLAPRINAAGRLYRADAGVELMLSQDASRAAQIGDELNRTNSERRSVEREVMNQAESARRELTPEQQSAPALVLAGEGWHPGVVGIVASRMVEKYWKPVVLIALDDGVGRGSGRSVPGYDLLSGIASGSEMLTRYGGHKMAAGLEIDGAKIESFREAFVQHASDALGPDGVARVTEVDSVIGAGGSGIDMGTAEQLESLEPFGMGNPRPNFLIPSVRLRSVRPMGQEGKHASFDLCSGSAKVKGVGFGLASQIEQIGDVAVDVEAQIELNRWGDSVEPRVVVREVFPAPDEDGEKTLYPGEPDQDSWWDRFASALSRSAGDIGEEVEFAGSGEKRVPVDRRDASIVPSVLDLACAEGSLLVISCDTRLRKGLLLAADPQRVGGGSPMIFEAGSDPAELISAAESGGSVFSDWEALDQMPTMAEAFDHVAVVDPPWSEAAMSWLERACASGDAPGFIHLLWHTRDLSAAETALNLRWDIRSVAIAVWRALKGHEEETLGREALLKTLVGGHSALAESPEAKGVALRALAEAGQVRVEEADRELSVSCLEGGLGLESSETYLACQERLEAGLAALRASEISSLERQQAA